MSKTCQMHGSGCVSIYCWTLFLCVFEFISGVRFCQPLMFLPDAWFLCFVLLLNLFYVSLILSVVLCEFDFVSGVMVVIRSQLSSPLIPPINYRLCLLVMWHYINQPSQIAMIIRVLLEKSTLTKMGKYRNTCTCIYVNHIVENSSS